MIKKLKVASAPHLRRQTTTRGTMIDVIISLIPVTIMAIKYFGSVVINLLLVSILVTGIAQFIGEKLLKKDSELGDYSFVVTAMLLTLSLPHTTPYWVLSLGSIFAIIFGKVIYGGLGKNLFNPALLGRVFMMVSFPQYILNYKSYDGSAGATILPLMKYTSMNSIYDSFGGKGEFIKGLFTGHEILGSMGEVSVIAILIGLIYLKLRGHVKLSVPFIIVSVVFIGGYFGGYNPLVYILSGGLIFGAVYMATDMVTSPYTRVGKMVYSLLIGICILIIRKFTSHPEGVAYAILFGNIFVPFINKHTKPRVFGRGYNMKEIKIAAISLGLTLVGLLLIFQIDKKLESNKEAKILLEKEKVMLEMVENSARIAKDEETTMYGGYVFRPIYNINEEKIAYVVEAKSKGYSKSEIEFLMAMALDGSCIGHHILAHEETKGLGSKIASNEWKNVFNNVTKDSKFDKETDAFSGATYTFRNMHKTIIDILKAYENETENTIDGESGATDIGWEEEVVEEVEETDGEAGSTDGDWSAYRRDGILWV